MLVNCGNRFCSFPPSPPLICAWHVDLRAGGGLNPLPTCIYPKIENQTVQVGLHGPYFLPPTASDGSSIESQSCDKGAIRSHYGSFRGGLGDWLRSTSSLLTQEEEGLSKAAGNRVPWPPPSDTWPHARQKGFEGWVQKEALSLTQASGPPAPAPDGFRCGQRLNW